MRDGDVGELKAPPDNFIAALVWIGAKPLGSPPPPPSGPWSCAAGGSGGPPNYLIPLTRNYSFLFI